MILKTLFFKLQTTYLYIIVYLANKKPTYKYLKEDYTI